MLVAGWNLFFEEKFWWCIKHHLFFHMEKNKRKKSKLNKNKLTGEVGFFFDHPTANEMSVTSLRCHVTCTSKWLRQVNLSFMISLWFLLCRSSFETIKWKPYPKLTLQNDTFQLAKMWMTVDWVNIEHIPSVKHCISVVMLHVVHPCQWSSMILGSGTVWKSTLCPSFPRGRLAGCLPHYHCLHLAIQKKWCLELNKERSCGVMRHAGEIPNFKSQTKNITVWINRFSLCCLLFLTCS